MSVSTISFDHKPGYCLCGCGRITSIFKQTSKAWGQVKGQHARYIVGHHKNHRRSSGHPKWKSTGIKRHDAGYWLLRVGQKHPLATSNTGYAYIHQLIWASAHCMMPPKDHVIHHKNGDKTDNRIENLEAITRAAHNSHHNAERGRRSDGTFKKAA